MGLKGHLKGSHMKPVAPAAERISSESRPNGAERAHANGGESERESGSVLSDLRLLAD
jgi:hypothetical protein